MQLRQSRILQNLSGISLAVSLLAACGSAPTTAVPPKAEPSSSSAAPTAPASGNDYANADSWLCRPGRADACSVDLSATTLAATGELTRKPWAAHANPPVDCFYVYPTISNDPTPNSDMTAGPEEKRAVQEQFARFGSECRLFAPVYRQVTLAGLRNVMQGQPSTADAKMAYGDVVDAWNHYLKHDNKGRGVILVGHSQGARMLADLVKNEIEGKPVQRQMVSAFLLGSNIAVPKGKDTGGQFQQIPLCRSADQTGCIVAYVSFRDNSPPPANSRFGRLKHANVTACTNPAALLGNRRQLHSYLPTKENLLGQPLSGSPWAAVAQKAATPFIETTDMVTAECVERDNASYLAVTVNPSFLAKGIDIPGDLVVSKRLFADWGLHLVDVDLAMGDLIAIARRQADAYVKRTH